VPVHLWIAGAQLGQDNAGFGLLGIVFHHQPLALGFNEMKVRLVDALQAGQGILQSAIFPETDAAVHSDKVTFAVHGSCTVVCMDRASPTRTPPKIIRHWISRGFFDADQISVESGNVAPSRWHHKPALLQTGPIEYKIDRVVRPNQR
jgi:hypothetical protein